MTIQVIMFWTLAGALVFAFALAVQMRVMVARILRIALEAHNPALDESEVRQAVAKTANRERPQDVAPGPDVDHLRLAHPQAIGHLQLARKSTRILPMFLILLLAVGRKILGVI